MIRVLAWLSFVIAVPALAGVPDSSINLRPWTRARAWDVELAPADEPGPRFEMSGHVLGPDDRPAAGVELYVYHADGHGWYSRRGEHFNRIAGVLRTNHRGEYRIRSILPGRYAGSGGHVHFELWKNGHPRRATFVGLYNEPGLLPVPTSDASRRGIRERNPHKAPITLDSAGVYRCRHDLRWRDMVEVAPSYDSQMRAMRKRFGDAHR